MNLYEFQAKELIGRFDIAIPRGRVAGSAEDAERLARRLAFPRFAIKAQIHGGGRGQAGGVRFASDPAEARTVTAALLKTRLVTQQTKPQGELVRWVYVEEALDIQQEIYAAVALDAAEGRLDLVVAPRGGVDIETTFSADPRSVQRFALHLTDEGATGDFEGAARFAGLSGDLLAAGAATFQNMARMAVTMDATLVEINPLALTLDRRLVALDGRLAIDENAMFRHPALSALRAQIQIEDGDPKELAADRHQINYQRMDGTIGVVVNGAGLALATNDMLLDAGLAPANFMDIRTTASSLDIAYGIGLILENPRIKAIFINIHGGGMQRCDTVAEGLTVAARRAKAIPPIVVRLQGNNADFARVRLKGSGLTVTEARDMADAMQLLKALASREAA